VPRIPYQDDTLRVGVAENLTIAVWYDAPTLPQMEVVHRIDTEKRRVVEGGLGFVNVIVSGVPRFTKDVREEVARQVALADDRDRALAHLILVEGLAGTATRAFLNTASLLARSRHPTKVFSEIEPTARFLTEHLDGEGGTRWSVEEMLGVFDAVMHPEV